MNLLNGLSIVMASCAINSQDSLLITRTFEASSCADYFSVSDELEPDLALNRVLAKYLYESLVDIYSCTIDSSEVKNLYTCESFFRSILLFYTDSRYESLNHFEYPERWKEQYVNLIRNCENIGVQYTIIDSLLSLNIPHGLQAIWTRPELGRLQHLDSYLKGALQEKSFYKCAELAVIFHNSGNIRGRKNLVDFLANERSAKDLSIRLRQLFDEFATVDHEQYVMKVFGGY